jgi:hypothetical protein
MPRKISMIDQTQISLRYAQSASAAGARYSLAIAKNTNWYAQASSDAAELHWQQGVTAAAAEKRRAAGLKAKSSQASWQTMANTKGAAHIAAGISAAVDKQKNGWAPFYSALSALELQDKTPGDPLGNLQRNAGRVIATLVNVKRAKEGATPITVP